MRSFGLLTLILPIDSDFALATYRIIYIFEPREEAAGRFAMKKVYLLIVAGALLASPCAFAGYNVRDYGATGDGKADDTVAIQSAINACDNAGGGTVFFPPGHYNETGLIVGAYAASTNHRQTYVFLEGGAPHASVLRYTGPNTGIAVRTQALIGGGIKRLDIVNAGKRGTTDGLQTSGPAGSNGTSTNNCILEQVSISGFHNGWHTSANGSPTSSEITANNLVLSNCDNGFYNDSFNGLNFVFTQLQTTGNTVGVWARMSGVYVFGGAASGNGTDFVFNNGGTNTIHGFRSETGGKFIDDSGPIGLSVLDCIAQALKGPDAIVLHSGNHISIHDSLIGGNIKIADRSAKAAVDISNSAVKSASIITIGAGVKEGVYRVFGCWTCTDDGFNVRTVYPDQQGTFSTSTGLVPKSFAPEPRSSISKGNAQ